MKKSVYSLVLSDDVVAKIDRMAYSRGTNRSNMINQILAEAVSYVTPEKRIREIFGRIEEALNGAESFRFTVRPSDTMLSLNSALTYRYNPTVKYSVELYRGTGGSIGELRVATRTQSDALILAMLQFYKLWMKVEQSRIGACEYAVEDGKFARKLCPRSLTGEQPDSDPTAIGNRIAEYIRVFDAAMKAFFYNLNTPAQAVAEVEKIYDRYLSDVGQTV